MVGRSVENEIEIRAEEVTSKMHLSPPPGGLG